MEEIKVVEPNYNITFWEDRQKIGELEWNSGELKFTGKIEESAKKFFDFLKPFVDQYIQEKIKELGDE